ncbi:MAG TPA: DUF2092 domain-containing protein, partial [Epsilonproteobacteria bacterium]|nr:DUF2092 domain-containing protein [Campylobacterota bacterium]
MILIKKAAAILSLSLFLASGTVYANANVPVTEEAQVNAATLLKNSYTYLGSLNKYAFTASITNSVDVDGEDVVIKRIADVKVKRPDQFRIDSKGENFNRSSYLSNGVFTMIENEEKYYASVKTGKGIDGTLDMINKKLGIVIPLSTLLHSDMDKFIHPKRVQYFGTRTVSGVECNYIAFRQGSTVVHLWIENSDTPLVRSAKIVTNDKNERGTTDMVMRWDTKPGFSDAVFVFKAPKGACNIAIRPAK